MKHIHVKNLEKYNPGYTDRSLIWCKTYFSMLNSDPEFEMLCEIDKWRFIAFTMLELQIKKPIPCNKGYLLRKGFCLKSRSIDKTIESLDELLEVVEYNNVTQLSETRNETVTQSRVEKSRVEESRVDMYVDFEQSTIIAWNSFCDKNPILSKIKEISDKRRTLLKKRFTKDSFKDFNKILSAIEEQDFLLGNNDKAWKVSFDWIISNDTNYLKILELKYSNTKKKIMNRSDFEVQKTDEYLKSLGVE